MVPLALAPWRSWSTLIDELPRWWPLLVGRVVSVPTRVVERPVVTPVISVLFVLSIPSVISLVPRRLVVPSIAPILRLPLARMSLNWTLPVERILPLKSLVVRAKEPVLLLEWCRLISLQLLNLLLKRIKVRFLIDKLLEVATTPAECTLRPIVLLSVPAVHPFEHRGVFETPLVKVVLRRSVELLGGIPLKLHILPHLRLLVAVNKAPIVHLRPLNIILRPSPIQKLLLLKIKILILPMIKLALRWGEIRGNLVLIEVLMSLLPLPCLLIIP